MHAIPHGYSYMLASASKQNNGDSHGINLHSKQWRIGHITVPTFDISFSLMDVPLY